MGRPFETLISQLLHRGRIPAHRGRSIFTPRRNLSRPLSDATSHLTLAIPESLESRRLWAVTPLLVSNVLYINISAGTDTAFIRELSGSIRVANSAANLASSPINTFAVSSINEIRVQDVAGVSGEQFTVVTSTGLSRFLNVTSTGGNIVDSVTINAPVSNRVLITANTLSLGSPITAGGLPVDLTVPNGNLTTTAAISGSTINVAVPNGSLTIQQALTGTANMSLSAQNAIQTIGGVSATNLTINSTAGSIALGGPTTATGAVNVTAASGSITVTAALGSGANSANFVAQNDITSTAAITAGALTINSTAGSISLGGPTTATGGLDANAAVNITVSGATTVTGGDATLTAAAGGVSVQAALTASANDISISADGGPVIVTSAGSVVGRNVSLQTTAGPIQADGNVTANLTTGLLTLDGPINASNPAATLGGAGTLSGQCLAIYMFSNRTLASAANFTSLTTNVSNVLGFVNTPLRIRNGSAANLTVSSVLSAAGAIDIQAAGNILVPSNLAVADNAALTLNSTGGSIRLNASLLVSNAPVVLSANASINGTGLINVASGSNASLSLTAGQSGGAGSINVTTRTDSLTARVNGTGTLQITEFDGLAIAAGNVSTANGSITITAGSLAGGNLNGAGAINAGGPASNVTLTNTRGGIVFAANNQVTAGNQLAITAQNAVNLGTNVGNLAATLTGSGESLTVREASGLGIIGGGVSTSSGPITITAGRFSSGDITGSGLVSAGAENVTITNANGAVTLNGTSGQISGNFLNVTAKNAVAINTNVTSATVTVTSPSQAANIQQLVQLGGLAVTTNAGDITVNLAAGNLLSASAINASNGTASGNVTLGAVGGNIAVGTITGNALNVTALNASALNTSVNSLVASITGAGENLTVTETNGLTIGTAGVRTNNAAILITAGNTVAGNLNGTGPINAGSGDVTLTNTRGAITLNAVANQVTGNVLTISAQNSVAVNTSVQTLNASVSTAAATLTVNESTGLGIQNATSAGGQIAITSGLFGPSTINGTGPVNATSAGNVTLTNANGGITLTGVNQVTGNVLTIAARDSVAVNTSVQTLNASVTNTSATLTVNEANGLAIANATTTGGQIAITGGLTIPGTITGTGPVNATSAGNVTLTNANGGITLTGVNQVTGNVLTIAAQNDVSLDANVSNLVAAIMGDGNLALVNAGSLTIDAPDAVTTANGAISITAAGLVLDGRLDAGPAGTPSDVSLNVTGLIAGTGNLTAGNLVWSAADQASDANWAYDSLNATVTGPGNGINIVRATPSPLTVFGLTTTSGPINVALTGLAGDLDLVGPVTAGGNDNVTLNVTNGAVTGTGLITGNVLDLTAVGSSSLTTNVASLVANVTGPFATLTISEDNGLAIAAGTSVTVNDAISIALTNGDFDLSGELNSTSLADVTISVPNGSITGTGNLTAGNLSWTALSQNTAASQNWTYTGLTADVTGPGNDLTISQSGALTIYGLFTDSGTINITPANSSVVTTVDLRGNVIAGYNVSQPFFNDVVVNLNGSITSNGGTIFADTLNLTAVNGADILTAITALAANVTGTGALTVNELDDLTIDAAGVSGAGDVNLFASGDISGPGTITAANLDLAANSAVVITAVGNLTASITGSGGLGLDVSQTGDLAIGAGLGIATSGDDVSINLTSGNLTGPGAIDAGAGDVFLTVANGGVNLPSVSAVNLTVAAQNSVVLGTDISGLAATISHPSGSLTVTETDDLSILAANVTTAGGGISIRSLTGAINGSGVLNAGGGNLTLTAATAIDLTAVPNQVVGNFLNAATTTGSINVNTDINRVSATAILGSVFINDVGDLAITSADEILAAPSGNITIQLSGNLSIAGNVTGDGGGFVTLNSTGGNITTSGANTLVFADTLDVRAATTSTLNTSVNSLTANISGLNAGLTVRNSFASGANAATGANLSIGPANVVLNGGTFSLTLATTTDASLGGSGSINAGGGNVLLSTANGGITLNATAGQISGNVLTIEARKSVAANTNVATLVAAITGSGSTLTINEASSLTAIGTNVATNGGAILINLANGSLTGSGNIIAGTGDVTLNASQGSITLNQSAGQVSGNVLTVTAATTSALNTAVNTLNANISGPGAALTVTEADGLTIGSGNVRTNNGQIAISTSAGGSLTRTGSISAGSANVSLSLAGGTSGTGLVSANQLTHNAGGDSSLNTTVNSVIATVSGAGNSLAIYQTGKDLVVPAGNVRTNGGPLTLSVDGTNNLTVLGAITAPGSTVTLAAGGAVNASSGQISTDTLTVTAATTSALNTAVNTLNANISGPGAALTVTEADGLTIGSGNVRTNNGQIAISTSAGGSLTRTGSISAGSANVSLSLAGGTSGTGLVSANQLTLNAGGTSTLNTAVGSFVADVTAGSLTIVDVDGLTVGAGGIRTNNAPIAITAQGGVLGGTGVVNAGTAAVLLTNTSGGIALASSANQVIATSVTVTATANSTLNTNTSILSGSITGPGQGLSVSQSGLLALGTLSANNGTLAFTAAAGLTGTGPISAGTGGTVVLNASAGGITLTGPNRVTASSLVVNSLTTATLTTAISTLDATISGVGSLIVNEADSLTVAQARTTDGAISLTTSPGSIVNVTNINAAQGANGNLTIVNGNVFIDAPGIRATQTVDLRLAQSVVILGGGIDAPVILLPNGQSSLIYIVTSPADAGPGSLRDVITRINAGGGRFDSTITVASPTTVGLLSALPAITVQVNVQGNNNLTLVGTDAGSAAAGFTFTSTSPRRSIISGVAFQNFGAAGVSLIDARNITVTRVTVTGSGVGFSASGNLAGSEVIGSSFTANVVGAMLTGAQNLTVGGVGQGNVFAGGTGFRGIATTGMVISGRSNGTVVIANTFDGYPTAVSIVAATRLRFGGLAAGEGNTIANASKAGIFARGFCNGSSVIKTTLPNGGPLSKRYVVSTSRNLRVVK